MPLSSRTLVLVEPARPRLTPRTHPRGTQSRCDVVARSTPESRSAFRIDVGRWDEPHPCRDPDPLDPDLPVVVVDAVVTALAEQHAVMGQKYQRLDPLAY